jgi:hypothetical protein
LSFETKRAKLTIADVIFLFEEIALRLFPPFDINSMLFLHVVLDKVIDRCFVGDINYTMTTLT